MNGLIKENIYGQSYSSSGIKEAPLIIPLNTYISGSMTSGYNAKESGHIMNKKNQNSLPNKIKCYVDYSSGYTTYIDIYVMGE